MAYVLRNVETGKTIQVEDEVWRALLKEAGENGWDPEGTRLDVPAMIDDMCCEVDDLGYDANANTWIMLQIMSFEGQWDGNYTDKENQIVGDGDGAMISYCLSGCDYDDELVDFLCEGEFMICAG